VIVWLPFNVSFKIKINGFQKYAPPEISFDPKTTNL
jgi:hypothetical protein